MINHRFRYSFIGALNKATEYIRKARRLPIAATAQRETLLLVALDYIEEARNAIREEED